VEAEPGGLAHLAGTVPPKDQAAAVGPQEPERVRAQHPARVRLRLDLGYDGSEFAGWAAQPGQRTVQGTLQTALAILFRVPQDDLELVVAGRTDSGVHATGQVCHVDVPAAAWATLPGQGATDPPTSLLRRLAGVLPADVRVHAAAAAPPAFDARFSAVWRRYAYRVSDHPAGVPPLRRHDVVPYPRPLDVTALDAAARGLVGLHDFAAYCRRREGATTIRTLREFSWCRDEDGLAVARVVADAFCHSMVRALVGAVLAVGDGRRAVEWPARVLAAGVRDSAVNVAPARGLVLAEVGYPPDAQLALRADEARARRRLPGSC
jgi:tRNA pseudouridine38-40 synthase